MSSEKRIQMVWKNKRTKFLRRKGEIFERGHTAERRDYMKKIHHNIIYPFWSGLAKSEYIRLTLVRAWAMQFCFQKRPFSQFILHRKTIRSGTSLRSYFGSSRNSEALIMGFQGKMSKYSDWNVLKNFFDVFSNIFSPLVLSILFLMDTGIRKTFIKPRLNDFKNDGTFVQLRLRLRKSFLTFLYLVRRLFFQLKNLKKSCQVEYGGSSRTSLRHEDRESGSSLRILCKGTRNEGFPHYSATNP